MSKKEIETYYPKSQTDWRNWLEKNHQLKQSVWLVFYKKSTKIASISWSESVDEALCFGWIDSTKKTIDEERYIQYFSKRKPNSIWSKVNKDKVEYLTSKKLIREAGYKSIETAKENGSWFIMDEVEALILPKALKEEFDKRKGALEYYESLSKSAKKILLSWIVLAKKTETKQKRIIKIAENASRNTKPKQFR
ncbi:YdeI/OmpD-associated family protein [Maribacter polysaccharolyticus]|uniref:YdeI/OmpD-associated family protein n=1 Tax=Maribacter polysaccharolyticus TaxID=3020831 RepID=UPI00237F0112|nr:YdeI/OmpD-associated family protein [Maribacter polysaccharolyticus]MDE3744157.1 YdeI/OmpD-associated family protein [Maribacter polysaccharolyticus]